MKFDWMDCGSGYHRCTTDKPVTIKAFNFGGTGTHNARITDMGYIMHRAGQYEGHIYGSVNQDAMPKGFNTLEAAKAYVEQQAQVGLTLNKLTR
jgi:hypothetical protein